MKRKMLAVLGLLMLHVALAFGQTQDTIVVTKKSLGTAFSFHGEILKPKQLLEMMQVNPAAYQEMKIAKSNYDIGTVIGFAGGFLVGWPLGTALGGGDPNWTLLGVGAGLVAVSIPFTTAYTRRAKKAVALYNEGQSQTGLQEYHYEIGLSRNGLGLRISF